MLENLQQKSLMWWLCYFLTLPRLFPNPKWIVLESPNFLAAT